MKKTSSVRKLLVVDRSDRYNKPEILEKFLNNTEMFIFAKQTIINTIVVTGQTVSQINF